MGVNWSLYENRLNVDGTTKTERNINRVKNNIIDKMDGNPSYKSVIINSNTIAQTLLINETIKPNVKQILSLPEESFNLGDYILWNENNWIITKCDSDETIQTKGEIEQCNYVLKFQNSKGDILSYPAIFEQNSSIGIDENNVISSTAQSYVVRIPFNDETKLLKVDKRFLCDNGAKIPSAYKLTKRDSLISNYQDGGVIKLTLTACGHNDEKDRDDLMIADYFIPKEEPNQSGISFYSVFKSSSTNNTLTMGSLSGRTVTATLYDNETTINTTVVPVWNIEYPVGFENQFTKTDVNPNKIKLVVADNMKLLNKEVKISVSDGNGSYLSDVLTMKIVAGV